jgi:hypothetical protein
VVEKALPWDQSGGLSAAPEELVQEPRVSVDQPAEGQLDEAGRVAEVQLAVAVLLVAARLA